MNVRIIPRFDIKGPNLVKGIHLEGLRVLGKPWYFAQKCYEEGADELLYMDVVASLYGRNNLTDIVKMTAERVFIPLTVGGGIRTVDDIRALLRAGADKVAINTAAIGNPTLISDGARAFGSQCIVCSIEAKVIDGRYEAMTDNGRERGGRDVFDWARHVVELGAGEILLTSVDRDGTGCGYDIELVRSIAEAVPVPVIACGGCGQAAHFVEAVEDGKADAISAASVFHYNYLDRSVDPDEFRDEGNIEFIRQRRGALAFMQGSISCMSIGGAKSALAEAGIRCRENGCTVTI